MQNVKEITTNVKSYNDYIKSYLTYRIWYFHSKKLTKIQMIFIYDISLSIYKTFIHIAAFFGNEKAKLWVNGRNDIFKHIDKSFFQNDKNDSNNNNRIVWMHVASLGEFEQGRPIIEQLKKDTTPYKIILTFFSPSGYEIRKNYPLADHIFYLPLDTAQNAKQFLDIIKPDLAIFVKYEFWYHYLNELHIRNTPTLLVSAIFREKQFSKTRPYTPYIIRVLKTFKHIFVQDTPSVSLLQKQGLTHITCAGDTRIDRVMAIAQEAKQFPIIEQFVGDAPVFIGGSTWQPDEEIILSLFSDPQFKNWKFIFAPHDISPKNIDRLEKLLPEPILRYSQITRPPAPKGSQPITNNQSRILVIDNVGMLSSIYRYGRVAYIGGGFGAGIHNTLEPIAFGLPVIFGLKYKKFAEAVSLVETGGGFSIADSTTFQEVMNHLLIEKNYNKASSAAKDYVEKNKGATAMIVEFIEKFQY